MITVDGLTKTYGSRRAVDELSFTVTGGLWVPNTRSWLVRRRFGTR